MKDKFAIEKILVPQENSSLGFIIVKFATNLETKEVFVGSGEDEWVIKNGINLDQINKLKLEVSNV